MNEEKTYKYKACPFRQGHYCGACELLMPNIDMCVFKCMNANMGLLTKFLKGDIAGAKKIEEVMDSGNKVQDTE